MILAVTIARAIELKHNPGLISALANETSKMYITAADSLQTLEQKTFGHWRACLLLKAKFYLSYVRTPDFELRLGCFSRKPFTIS